MMIDAFALGSKIAFANKLPNGYVIQNAVA